MNAQIRKAYPSDLPQFIKNLRSVAREGRYLFIEFVAADDEPMITQLIKDKDCLVLIAEVDKKAVGALELGWYGSGNKVRHTRMLSMFIIRGYRGKGIGTKLMARALRWARSRQDIEKICLGVFSSNPRAVHLYEKFGFELDGIKKRQYLIDGKYADEINMALFLR